MPKFKYKLGHKLRCKLTHFEGIVDQRTECLNGCLRYSIVARMEKSDTEAKQLEADEQQLEKIDNGLLKKEKIKKTKTGGPMKFKTY